MGEDLYLARMMWRHGEGESLTESLKGRMTEDAHGTEAEDEKKMIGLE